MGGRFSRRAALCAVAFGGCVCGRGTPEGGLSIDAVDPGMVVAGVAVPVQVRGSGFHLAVTADLGAKAATSESIVLLAGDIPLQAPVLRGDGLIEATLPDTLAPGVYPVKLSLGSREAP